MTAAAWTASPALNAIGANEKINLGFIGLGGRGSFHFRQFQDFDNVNIVSLCDA